MIESCFFFKPNHQTSQVITLLFICCLKKKTNNKNTYGAPVSHAIMSSVQYYPEDITAYCICNNVRRTVLHMQSCPPRRCCIMLCPPGHICIMQLCPPRAKPSVQLINRPWATEHVQHFFYKLEGL